MGIDLVIQDSLQWARVVCPGLKFYGLKEIRQWALGKPARKEFKEMVSYRRMETRTRARFVERCVCGAVPCRKRQTSTWWDDTLGWERHHERVTQTVLTQTDHEVDDKYPVEMFYPGSPLVPADRLAEWWDYSRVDAEDGIEIVDWLRSRRVPNHVFPWRHDAAVST